MKNIVAAVQAEEVITSSVKLFDDQSFKLLSTFELDPKELGTSLASGKIEGDPTEYYAVGTAYVIPEEADPTKVSFQYARCDLESKF